MASLRRQGVADRAAAAAQPISVDACASSQVQPPVPLQMNEKSAAGASRRRTRKKRDSGSARAAADAAGDSTDTSEDISAATDMSRPKLRRKKKPKKKTKKNSVECLRVENLTAPVQTIVAEVNDVQELRFQEDSRHNGAVTTADHQSSSFVDLCVASPDVDRLSCEPDGSSSRPEAEVNDYSTCSMIGSSRSRSRSPVPQIPPSTVASTSLYGQQSGLISDVHGSLPVLTRTLTDDRRLVAASDRSSDVCRLPKSVSLQGYQNLLSVDDAALGRRYHQRRHLTAPGYRPLTGQRCRRTLSRLDVEYINRSQIFEMISGR